MKWYVTTVLMPDDKLYVGINEYYKGVESELGFITIAENEQDAEALCKVYSEKHNIPMFEEYREVITNA